MSLTCRIETLMVRCTTRADEMTFGVELLGALAIIAGGGALLWHAFRGGQASRESEMIVIETVDPKPGA
jgi:hypothetical protein